MNRILFDLLAPAHRKIAIICLCLCMNLVHGQVDYCRYAQLREDDLLAQHIEFDVIQLHKDTCSILLANEVVHMYCASHNDGLLAILDGMSQKSDGFLSEHMIDITSKLIKCHPETLLMRVCRKAHIEGMGRWVAFYVEEGAIGSEEFKVIEKFVQTNPRQVRRCGAFKELRSLVNGRLATPHP